MVVEVLAALQRLIFVCPDYADVWRGERASDVVDGIPPPEEYVETGDLADWVVERLSANDHTCFQELFQVVEDLLLSGTDDVRMLLRIGLLEDIQYGLGRGQHPAAEPDDLVHYFGPETRRSWLEVRSWLNRPPQT